jgi:hypothetical protein
LPLYVFTLNEHEILRMTGSNKWKYFLLYFFWLLTPPLFWAGRLSGRILESLIKSEKQIYLPKKNISRYYNHGKYGKTRNLCARNSVFPCIPAFSGSPLLELKSTEWNKAYSGI